MFSLMVSVAVLLAVGASYCVGIITMMDLFTSRFRVIGAVMFFGDLGGVRVLPFRRPGDGLADPGEQNNNER